jgi:hypothetical protein
VALRWTGGRAHVSPRRCYFGAVASPALREASIHGTIRSATAGPWRPRHREPESRRDRRAVGSTSNGEASQSRVGVGTELAARDSSLCGVRWAPSGLDAGKDQAVGEGARSASARSVSRLPFTGSTGFLRFFDLAPPMTGNGSGLPPLGRWESGATDGRPSSMDRSVGRPELAGSDCTAHCLGWPGPNHPAGAEGSAFRGCKGPSRASARRPGAGHSGGCGSMWAGRSGQDCGFFSRLGGGSREPRGRAHSISPHRQRGPAYAALRGSLSEQPRSCPYRRMPDQVVRLGPLFTCGVR